MVSLTHASATERSGLQHKICTTHCTSRCRVRQPALWCCKHLCLWARSSSVATLVAADGTPANFAAPALGRSTHARQCHDCCSTWPLLLPCQPPATCFSCAAARGLDAKLGHSLGAERSGCPHAARRQGRHRLCAAARGTAGKLPWLRRQSRRRSTGAQPQHDRRTYVEHCT